MNHKQDLFRKIISVSATSAVMIAATTPVMAANETVPTSNDVEVIIIYKNEIGKESVLAAAKEVVTEFSVISAITVVINESQIDELKADPNIRSVEHNVKIETEDTAEVFELADSATITGTAEQELNWGFQAVNKDGASFTNGITGKGVKVAVIDSGIQAHRDLQIAGGVSTVDGVQSYSDDNGHGTHVAGIIAAQNNNYGTVGVAPDVQLYAVKALPSSGTGNLNDVLEGIQWSIQNDMDILNLSLGSESDVPVMRLMLEEADSDGILVVAAAGNDGGTKPVNYPAQYASTIAVTAVDSSKQLASFSNYGSTVDIAAPGVQILSTYLNGNHAWSSGTSQATPHVTGILALLKQQFPNMTDEQLTEELYKRVEDLGPTGYDVKFGQGLATYSGDVTAPAEVSNIKTISVKEREFTIGWDKPADSDYVSTKLYIDGTLFKSLSKGETSITVTDRKPNTTYSMTLKTVDARGNESKGATYQITTIADVTPPNEVTNLSATAIDHQKVKLNWQNPADQDFASVNVYKDGNKIKNVTGNELVVDSLNPSTSYAFTIKTVDTFNNESVGVTKSAATAAAPAPVVNQAPVGSTAPSAPPVASEPAPMPAPTQPAPVPTQPAPSQPEPAPATSPIASAPQPAPEAPKSEVTVPSTKPAPGQTVAEVVKEIKGEASKAQKQFAPKVKNGTTAMNARKDLAKTMNSVKATDKSEVAKVIGQYQAVISYYAKTKSYASVLATVKEATVGLSKKNVDQAVLVETVLKPNLSSSSSASAIIAELKKNKMDTKAIEVFRNELKQAEIGRSILSKHQQKASNFAQRKSYSNVVREVAAGVIEATKKKASNSDILSFVKKNIKSTSSVQTIINEMKKAKLDTVDMEKYKKDLK
ncbi:S8 family serine peptidase [Chungangia koreensis]|uniref:S8 family serine peptidase n=1 Tax=Chungangia koreensis TaxID=752657 RepID=A0ABV8X6D4_9LACT